MTAVRSIFGLIALFLTAAPLCAVSSNNKADPYPVYTAADPHLFLTRALRHCLKGYVPYDLCSERGCKTSPYFTTPLCGNSCPERLRISASIFRQGADTATDINRNPNIPIGDILGRWNVLGVLYPERDGNSTIRNEVLTALGLNNGLTPSETACLTMIGNAYNSDAQQEFGFFSTWIKYRKYGARFVLDFALTGDIGFILEAGVSDIKQTATFEDLTCSATGLCCPVRDCDPTDSSCSTSNAEGDNGPCITANCSVDVFNCGCKEFVIDRFMKQFDPLITRVIPICVDNFEKISAEDTRLKVFWRHIYEFNEHRPTWPHFLFIPFLVLEVTFPTGRKKIENHLLDVPSGNNGHFGLGFTAGFSLDFPETVELVFEGSMTKFNSRLYCNVPVPTNQLQSTVFPRLADLNVQPGTSWNFGITLNAYHFIDRLSCYVQYVMVDHDNDCYSIVSSNTASSNILLKKLVEESRWTAHMINTAFQYDIAPHMQLGFLWQAPVALRNAYRSTTVMGSLIITY